MTRFEQGWEESEMLRGYVVALFCAAAVASMSALAAEPIKIGFPIPLSGPTAVYGEPVLKGAELAVSEINAKGGVLGRKLELLSRDSKAKCRRGGAPSARTDHQG